MSKYTTEVRYICETAAGYDDSKGFSDVDSIIADAIPSIFSFDFPIFDENYREVLCTKILRHYYTREIGLETVGLWKLKLQTKLNEIMPFYNQFYQSELIKFNPLYDVDLTTTHVGDKNGETNRTENRNGLESVSNNRSENGSITNSADRVEAENKAGSNQTDEVSNEIDNRNNSRSDVTGETANNTHYDLYSDTPQGALTGVEAQDYLTNARKITDGQNKTGNSQSAENSSGSKTGSANVANSFDEKNNRSSISNESTTDNRSSTDTSNRNSLQNVSGSDKFNSTESYVLHVLGKQAGTSFSKLLNEFRETFLNIDMEIIDALSDLFLNLW